MGIRIANRGGRYGTKAFCDNCGCEVFDGGCNVLTLRHFDEGHSEPIVIACKRHCTDVVDPDRQMANAELGQVWIELAANAGIDVNEAAETKSIFYLMDGGL